MEVKKRKGNKRMKTVKGMFRYKAARSMALPFMLALCLLLAACGGNPESSPSDGGSTSGADRQEDQTPENGGKKEPLAPVEVGDDYRDFTATLADGSSITLSDHEGTVILLNFWATWCGPCVREMPAFPMLVEKYGEDLTLLAVNLGEAEVNVKSFLERNEYAFPVALDQEGEIGMLYPSDGIPYTVLIGRDGKIASIHLGADTADAMYAAYCEEIDALLEEE